MHKRKNKDGFIALTTVILISTSIIALLYIKSLDNSYYFDAVQLKSIRIRNYFNALNCIDRAIQYISQDYFYEINSPKVIEDLHCGIDMVKKGNEYLYIYTTGNFKNINIKRQAKIRLYDNGLDVISIQ